MRSGDGRPTWSRIQRALLHADAKGCRRVRFTAVSMVKVDEATVAAQQRPAAMVSSCGVVFCRVVTLTSTEPCGHSRKPVCASGDPSMQWPLGSGEVM